MSVDLLPHIMDLKEKVARIDERTERMEGHEGRITSLEHDRTTTRAVVATGASLGGAAGAVLSWLLAYFHKVSG